MEKKVYPGYFGQEGYLIVYLVSSTAFSAEVNEISKSEKTAVCSRKE